MMPVILKIARREVAIHMQRRAEWAAVLIFYLLCSSLFPIAVGNWPRELVWISPVIIWISVLLAIMLAQETLLREDFRIGLFDVLFLHPLPFSFLILVKILVHWLIFALPIVLLTPLVAISYGLNEQAILAITSSIFIGTLFLSLIAAVGAALTVPLARGGTFVALLILPLYMPILCVGSKLGILSVQGSPIAAHFALLGALTIIALLSVPLLVATAIKVSME